MYFGIPPGKKKIKKVHYYAPCWYKDMEGRRYALEIWKVVDMSWGYGWLTICGNGYAIKDMEGTLKFLPTLISKHIQNNLDKLCYLNTCLIKGAFKLRLNGF